MRVPLVDLKAQHQELRAELEPAFRQVVEQARFSAGPFVSRFEQEFASFCGCRFAVGVGNGTETLWLTLMALGIGPGHEVVTVPNTFIATAEAIRLTGATPVFIDVDEETYTMKPTLLEAAITARTRAILPVHLFGQPADLDPICDLARAAGLAVVEDASQAHGADYKGRRAGSIGIAGCFSFYPSKNLGACGEAGAVVTNDPDLAERVRRLRDHGQNSKYDHAEFGWNARMDDLQAALLSIKLKRLPQWNEARRKNASRYGHLLSGLEGVRTPREASYAKHVYHIYAVRLARRDGLKATLQESGIECGIHYPVPLHLQPAFSYLKLEGGRFPVAESCARELLSLPMFPELTEEQMEYVAAEASRFLQAGSAVTPYGRN